MMVDLDRISKLFQIAEAAPKFPHMSGRVLEWVRMQLLEVDKEITQEIETLRADVQKKHDANVAAAQKRAADQAKVDEKNTPKPVPQMPQNMPGQPVVDLSPGAINRTEPMEGEPVVDEQPGFVDPAAHVRRL